MARPLRIEYQNAFYHVTARGNERKEIFRDDKDREQFLGYLESATERYQAVIYTYCLMDNHYHLLLSTPEGNLSQIMRHINGGYTTWFNKRHNRNGHLFQGRYKAILVEADPYAGELSRYIHLNPVRAEIVRIPEEYKWSSYAAYIGRTRPPRWLTTDWLLKYFGRKPTEAKKAYINFVKAAIGKDKEDPLKEATTTLILGRADFVDKIKEKYLSNKDTCRDIPAMKELKKISPEEIHRASKEEFKDEPDIARKAAIYLSHRYSGRSLREIGREFGIGESAVSQASRRFETEMTGSRKTKRRVENVKRSLGLSNV
jgi:REP element-mobilizing transposase RayT